jgi:hypothetical protein
VREVRRTCIALNLVRQQLGVLHAFSLSELSARG